MPSSRTHTHSRRLSTFVAHSLRWMGAASLVVLILALVLPGAGTSSVPPEGPSAPLGVYRDLVLGDDPVSYWRLGEPTGTVAADEQGANPGTYINGTALGAPGALWGDTDTSASFDGLDDYVAVESSSSLSPTDAVSVEAWVRRTTSAVWMPLVGKPLNGASRLESYSLWLTGERVTAFYGDGTDYLSVTSDASLDTGWHHIVATYDNTTAKIYVDGTLSGTQAGAIQLTPNTDDLQLARTNSGWRAYPGGLDEVAVYATALSAEQVANHYAAGHMGSAPPSVSLSSPLDGSRTSDRTPAFAGVAGTEADDIPEVTLKVYLGPDPTGVPVQTLQAAVGPLGGFTVDALPPLVDGVYTAQAEQTDTDGNRGLSAAPTFTVDTIPPVAAITSHPDDPSSEREAEFTFNANEAGSTFFCRLDSASFAACTSPRSYSDLADGDHTFTVKAVDRAGNAGVPVSYAWTISTQVGWPPGFGAALPQRLGLSEGQVFYVATDGSDSDPGTISRPWRTIQYALDTLQPGQKAYVRAGTYTQSLVMDEAGTREAPITVQAYPGERPVIHAGGSGTMDYPVRITAGAAYFRLDGFIIEDAPLDGTMNVWISDGGQSYPNSAHDIQITRCEIRDGTGTGLFVSPRTERVHILRNIVHGNGIGTVHQHQGIYFQGQNGLIAENIVYGQPNGFGIQIRGQGETPEEPVFPATNVIVAGNTSVDNSLAGIVVENNATLTTIVNNITAYNGTNGVFGYNNGNGTVLPGNVAYNNVGYGNATGNFRNGSANVIDYSGGNILEDPRFVDAGNADFHVQAGSPAIDNALDAYSMFWDRSGVRRPQGQGPDLGVYERAAAG